MAHAMQTAQRLSSLAQPSGRTSGSRGCRAPAPFRGARPARSQPRTAPSAAAPALSRGAVLLRAVRADQQADGLDTATVQLIADLTKQVDTQVATTVQANNEAALARDATTTSDLREKVVAGINRLSKGLLERETEVRGEGLRGGGGCHGAACRRMRRSGYAASCCLSNKHTISTPQISCLDH